MKREKSSRTSNACSRSSPTRTSQKSACHRALRRGASKRTGSGPRGARLGVHQRVTVAAQHAGDGLDRQPPAHEPFELSAELGGTHRRVLLLPLQDGGDLGSLSPCAGSAGAYGDFSCAGRDACCAGGVDAFLATGGAGIVPAVVASLTQRRSDSVVVPMVAATCTRLIPDATSTSACCLCASSNLRPCGATSERAGAAAF
jgi:hypothetical protein